MKHLISVFLVILYVVISINVNALDSSDNIILNKTPIKIRGVENAKLITDGWMTIEGESASSSDAALMKGLRSYAIWDLGRVYTLKTAQIQADNNDNFNLYVSIDGKEYIKIWDIEKPSESGLRLRFNNSFDVKARFIKLNCTRGDKIRSVTELQLFSDALPQPALSNVKSDLNITDEAIRENQIYALQIVTGLLALFLIFIVFPRLKKQYGLIMMGTLALLLFAAWTKFGTFQNNTVLHVWDGYHYFMSSKYFKEIGYYDLYRCVAKAAREDGFDDDVDKSTIRDLDDNTVHSGVWTRTVEGRCRGSFTTARWNEFKNDVRAYKKLFPENLPILRSFVDHGFNATPVHAAWLHLITKSINVSEKALIWLAQLDSLAFILIIAVLWWGFGPVVAVSAAVVLGIGFEWGYRWVGGSLGRYTWLLFAASGISFLKKEKTTAGTAMLTIAGLLRLFPFVFVGGLGLYALINWIKKRKLEPEYKKIILTVIVTIFAGVTFAGVTLGYRTIPQFINVAQVHADTSLVNQLGLQVVLGTAEGERAVQMYNPRLTDPDSTWKQKLKLNKKLRLPIWIFSIIVSMLFIIYTAIKGFKSWEVVAATGPLLFSLHNTTSYDYVWLIIMLPLGIGALYRIRWLIYFTLFTLVLGTYTAEMEMQHITNSWVLIFLMFMFMKDIFNQLDKKDNSLDSPKHLETS